MTRDGAIIMRLIRRARPTAGPADGDSHLYDDLGFDSLGFVRLLLRIEQRLSVTFDLMEMQDCLRVGRLIELVERKRKEARGHDSPTAGDAEAPGGHRGH